MRNGDRKLVWVAIILASAGWGSGDVVTRVALREGTGPYALSAIRCIIAAVGVGAFLVVRGRTSGPRQKVMWKLAAVQGVASLAAPYLLITLALRHASAGFVGIVIALVPVCTALFAHVMLSDEKLRLAMMAGFTVASVGVSILLASGNTGLASGGRPLLAFVLTAVAVILIGYGAVFAKRVAESYDPFSLALQQFVLGAMILSILLLLVEGFPVDMQSMDWLLVGYMGIVGTLLPFLAFFWCLQRASATLVSLSGYLTPPIALVTGIILLDERLQPGLAIGGALILVGVAITELLDRQREPTLFKRRVD